MIELGGNIELVGFKELDKDTLVVVKKVVGNYAKKFSEGIKNFEKLSVTMKPIHGEGSGKFELHAKLIHDGNPITTSIEERNLFFALDAVLKKLEHQLGEK